MTFNMHHGVGTDGRLNLDRVAQVIRSAGADAVGLQEVDRHFGARSDFVDQATWLADDLGMYVAFGANLDLDPLVPGQPRRQYGNAILSGGPILDWENTHLPRFDGHEQRGLLRARIVVSGRPVQVYDTHLQHNDAAERLAQARAIVPLVADPGDPVVLLGDLNATPGAPEIRTLTGTLVDGWAAVGVGAGYTHPSGRPSRRIDYVMVSPDVVVDSIAVPRSGAASDHLPVVADLSPPGNGDLGVAEFRRAAARPAAGSVPRPRWAAWSRSRSASPRSE
jgi:endonuclease/exonuclease/phosphatase family metal-dependent hydrolase